MTRVKYRNGDGANTTAPASNGCCGPMGIATARLPHTIDRGLPSSGADRSACRLVPHAGLSRDALGPPQ
jgi:hypothetical protein